MKHLLLILSAAAVLMVGCKHEDHVIGDIEDRLELLENGSFPKVDAQIDSINSSLIELKKTNDELDSYIEDLEKTAAAVQKQLDEANSAIERLEANFTEDGQEDVLKELNELKSSTENELAAIKATIEELKSKDIELEKAIDDLEVFVSEELAKYATTEWAEATFATLEQYNNIQEQLTAINALVISTQESIVALEERVNEKIETDISAAVEGLEDSIASEVSAITEAYTSAISDARNEIEAAYTEAIAKAISDSETSIKKWVNEVLAEGYYTISEVDLMIRILEGRIKSLENNLPSGEGDNGGGSDISAVEIAHLQKQITALETALENAKTELTEEFEKAITEAIKNDGNIDKKIADAVKDALSVLQTQIDAINLTIEDIRGEIEAINKRIDDVEADIKDIKEQIEGINGSIDDLKSTDKDLDEYISTLEDTAADLQEQLDKAKDAIQSLEANFTEEGHSDIVKILREFEDAIKKELATIKENIKSLKTKDSELETAISELEKYVNEELADYASSEWVEATFATIEQYNVIQEKLAAIDALIKTTEESIVALEKRVNEKIETDIAKAVEYLEGYIADEVNSITTAYTEAISTAKSEIEDAHTDLNEQIGAINIAIEGIKEDIKALCDRLDAVESDIQDIQNQIEKLMNQIQSISYIPRTTDGTIRVSLTPEGTAAAFLDFFVSPVSAVTTLNTDELWKTALSVQAVYTDTEGTGNLQLVTLPVTEYNGNDTDGIVTVKVDASGLGDEFFAAAVEVSAFLKISDGNTNHVSDYVRMTANSTIWPGNFTVNDWIVAHEIEGDANEN